MLKSGAESIFGKFENWFLIVSALLSMFSWQNREKVGVAVFGLPFRSGRPWPRWTQSPWTRRSGTWSRAASRCRWPAPGETSAGTCASSWGSSVNWKIIMKQNSQPGNRLQNRIRNRLFFSRVGELRSRTRLIIRVRAAEVDLSTLERHRKGITQCHERERSLALFALYARVSLSLSLSLSLSGALYIKRVLFLKWNFRRRKSIRKVLRNSMSIFHREKNRMFDPAVFPWWFRSLSPIL